MKNRVALMMMVLLSVAFDLAAFTVSEINFWAGQGANQAVLVIDWNTGPQPQSLAWGYRWDGNALAEDALRAVVNADSRLDWQVGQPGQYGLPLKGLSYDLDNDGFLGVGADESTTAADAGDLHANGWLTAGFWALYEGGQAIQPVWKSSWSGISGYTLQANDWVGLSFGAAPGWDGGAPDEPVAAAVPEPASMVMLLTGAAALLRKHKRTK